MLRKHLMKFLSTKAVPRQSVTTSPAVRTAQYKEIPKLAFYRSSTASGMDETLGEAGRSLSPFIILLIVIALQSLDVLLEKLKKRGSTSSEEIKLREEIKGLLKEANSLSTPSTFAQAAKLRRLAAAKEKELKKKQEHNNDEQWSLYAKVLLASKAIIYSGLCWKFWSTHVAVVAPHLLQPFGRVLSWRGNDASSGNYMVGIVPWLVLTSRVSKFLLQRFSKFIPL